MKQKRLSQRHQKNRLPLWNQQQECPQCPALPAVILRLCLSAPLPQLLLMLHPLPLHVLLSEAARWVRPYLRLAVLEPPLLLAPRQSQPVRPGLRRWANQGPLGSHSLCCRISTFVRQRQQPRAHPLPGFQGMLAPPRLQCVGLLSSAGSWFHLPVPWPFDPSHKDFQVYIKA